MPARTLPSVRSEPDAANNMARGAVCTPQMRVCINITRVPTAKRTSPARPGWAEEMLEKFLQGPCERFDDEHTGTRHERERPGARKLRLTDSGALSSSGFMQRNLKYGRGGAVMAVTVWILAAVDQTLSMSR